MFKLKEAFTLNLVITLFLLSSGTGSIAMWAPADFFETEVAIPSDEEMERDLNNNLKNGWELSPTELKWYQQKIEATEADSRKDIKDTEADSCKVAMKHFIEKGEDLGRKLNESEEKNNFEIFKKTRNEIANLWNFWSNYYKNHKSVIEHDETAEYQKLFKTQKEELKEVTTKINNALQKNLEDLNNYQNTETTNRNLISNQREFGLRLNKF